MSRSSPSLPLLAMLIVSSAARSAAGQAPRSHALEYDAIAECPARDRFERTVTERVGSNPFSADATRTLAIELGRDGATWRGKLSVSEGETALGTQTLESQSADCSELFSAAVLVASVMLGNPAPAEAAPPPAPPPAPAVPAAKAKPPPRAAPRRGPERRTSAAAPPSSPAPKIFAGIELAQDLALYEGGDACRPDSDRFDCYLEGTDMRFEGTPADHTGKTASGLLPGAQRWLATLTWELATNLALDVRLGAALGSDVPDFVPWHAEVGPRLFLGESSATLRGFVGASLGYAAFDTKLRVDILDCEPPGTDCTPTGGEPPTRVDAVERRGPVFVAGRIGLRWMIATPHSLSPTLGVHVPFPDTGVVLVPSLAYAVGF